MSFLLLENRLSIDTLVVPGYFIDRFLPAAHHSRHPRDVRVSHHPRYSARYDAQLRNGVYYLHRRVVPRILRALCGCLYPHRKGVLPHHQRR